MASSTRLRIVVCVLGGLLLTGCPERRRVVFRTNPSGAETLISSDRGLRDFPIGRTRPGGLEYVLQFDSDPAKGPFVYTVDFRLEGYEPNKVTIRLEDEQTDYSIRLTPEVVREVSRLEISPEADYKIEPRRVRAWVEDIEREGMPASNIVKLGDFQSILGMSISGDGDTLVFSLAEVVRDEDGKEGMVANLRAVQAGGGGITEMTSGQWLDSFPSLGADGSLYFCADRLRRGSADIFRISSEKTGAIAVIRQTPEGSNYQPSVGSGGVIAFTYRPVYRGKAAGNPQVWTLGGESQYPTQLREGSMPSVSPDGNEIAYIGPDGQLWKVPVSGQNPVQLTSTPGPGGKKHPSWSPDGEYILYASDEGKDSKNVANYDIWMIRADGTSPVQLTTNGSLDDFPLVSADQQYIYFCSNRGFKEGIWRIPFPVPRVRTNPGQ